MDWNNASDSQVAVAVIRLPAKVDVSDPRYGGSVLVNPGGPGGSGVNLVRLHGDNLQTIIDSPLSSNDSESKYFDIVAFDPRGVGFTTPSFTCFANSQQRLLWQIASNTDGLLGSSDVAFSRIWARKQALAEACNEVGDERISIRMNTAIVAMDMAAVVEALATWRREKTGKSHSDWNKSQYWGFSYGTVLGETFASMYPHLVSRLVLDGVVDSDRHYAGTWDGNIDDADAIMKRFSIYCYRAGPNKCPLFSEKGPGFIQSELDNIIANSENTTKSVQSSHGPEIVTHSDVQKIIRDSLYEPFKEFEGLAQALYNLANGDGSIIANRKQTSSLFSEPADYAEEAVGAISCTDGLDQTNITKEEFVEYWQKMRHQSIYLGDRWSQNRLLCLFWKTRPELVYPAIFKGPIGARTEPILFIGNTLDPVTSLDNAKKMSQKFPGSGLIQQDSEGHLSLSTPSLCTAKAIRAYFQTGTLPAHGTLCKVYDRPFDLPGDRTTLLQEGDDDLLKALRAIAGEMW
ncbi:hypothetical protein N7494_004155 [Penicillium frequentans]|uniref:Peptidase S33 tripeptidyl aminopeptidase-like C-terminal domain-containing protein n=1 Tax=Penicillium frequentans TaxID=3151616 RepID=A0AAD6GGC2_9EURO|nr:hypothetical protein N7494_004155 [Penicillium glabrum]